MLNFLDIFLFIFHSALIVFNTLGWIPKVARKYNLATLLLTGFSWFGLGIWYGWGYCFCTDWHWQIRFKLGNTDQSNSYIQFLIEKLFSLNVTAKAADSITAIVFAVSLIASLTLNIKDFVQKR